MPSERLQLRLVKLALRELGGKASSYEIIKWIGSNYSRSRVGLKKARYLLRKDEEVVYEKIGKEYYFWFNTPKLRVRDIIEAGVTKLGSRGRLAKALDSSTSQLLEWKRGTMHPSQKSLDRLDRFVEEYLS